MVAKLGKKKDLEASEKISLENARAVLENPPHLWVLKLFDRIGEPRPKVGKEVTGNNPLKAARQTPPSVRGEPGRVGVVGAEISL